MLILFKIKTKWFYQTIFDIYYWFQISSYILNSLEIIRTLIVAIANFVKTAISNFFIFSIN